MVCGLGGLSGLHIGGREFGGLGLQGHPDGYSVRNVFKSLFNEEGTGSGNSFFEGVIKFSAYESSNKFNSTDSVDWGGIGERSRGYWGVIGERGAGGDPVSSYREIAGYL